VKELLSAKKLLQKKIRERFGNAPLYDLLALPSYRRVWLAEGLDGKVSDALEAWAHCTECEEDIQHLTDDPAFTPAHCEYSPRFFRWAETNNKTHQRWDGKSPFKVIVDALDFRHSPPIPSQLRIHYRAPRLIRDGLRREGEALDIEHPDCDWLPPVLKPLPQFHGQAMQSFVRVAVRLMPLSRTNFQLVAEPELLNQERVKTWREQHGAVFWWGAIEKNGDKACRRLKWPTALDSAEASAEWFKRGRVSCLSVDLGVRASGAFKVLEACATGQEQACGGPSANRFSRTRTPKGYFSPWICFTLAEGLLRLRGEDAIVYRRPTMEEVVKNPDLDPKAKSLLREFSGRKGRNASENETTDAEELFNKLGYRIKDNWIHWKSAASFPEQNDELLRAISWIRSRLYRLHRWAWMLAADEKRRAACIEQLAELSNDSPFVELRALVADQAKLETRIQDLWTAYRPAFMEGVTTVSNRILPSKRGRFQWTQTGEWHEMRLVKCVGCEQTKLAGQRGLSVERITQMQRLRQMVQSLNHLCRHEIRKRYRIPKRGSVPDPFKVCGDALEDARADRAKQIAHQIFALALGVEIAPPPPDKEQRKETESLHAVYRLIKGRRPVEFIALEDLSKFRTSELLGRQENRQLALWSHRRIVKHLTELCELVGMPIVFVDPAFTSCYSARNGAVGFRAVEIRANDPSIGWLSRRAADGDTRAAILLAQVQCAPAGKPLLLPQGGGPLFVELRSTEGSAEVMLPPTVHAISMRLTALVFARWLISTRRNFNPKFS
jgi:IS605 OrfB family transposase